MTFIDNWRISSFTAGSAGGGNPQLFVGVGIIVEVTGNFTISHATSATITFRLTGAGSTMNGTRNFAGNINIDVGTGNTLNIINFSFNGGSLLKWTSGTVNHTGAISCQASTLSLDLANVIFNNYSSLFNTNTTLISDANFNNVTLGSVTGGTGCSVNGIGWRLKCRGNLVLQQTVGGISGTGIISCTGTGTITSNNTCSANFEVSSSGIYTLLSTTSFGGAGKSVVVAGILNTGATTTSFVSGTTISAIGANWFNVTIPAAATIIINQLLSVTGTLAITSGTTTFQGTAGWTCVTLTCFTPSTTITLQEAITYTTTTNVVMLGTNATRILMRSSDTSFPYVLAKWTLTNTPATQSMVYVSATAIDSSEGMTIYSFQGLTNGIDASTLNWFNGASQGTKAFTFVS
jgi:hypothetical protein